MRERIAWTVSAEDDGRRLDTALAARVEVSSRAGAQRLLDSGSVRVDGVTRRKAHRLSAGERVEALTADGSPAQLAPPEAQDRVAIVYSDDELLVVDKPAGLVVHPAASHPTGTLVQALAGLAAGGPEVWRPGIVHRLDRDTSGLMVVARTERAHAALGDLIRGRALEREYLALVDGRPDARTGVIDAPIGRDRRERTLHSTRTDRPRAARTHFVLERALPRTTLLRVRLETGRTHQIRVHMAAIGHPICGDSQYGGGPCGARLGLGRQFLHSARLAFTHPVTGEALICDSELPADLREASAAAEREGVPEPHDGSSA